ncbi:MAG: TadE family type IV pilus minor pilin [Actinomycetes bacterium]
MRSRSCSETTPGSSLGGGRPSPAAPERGSVTAEMAVVLPALMLVLGLALGAVGHAITVVRATDAARSAARAAARGDSDVSVTDQAHRALPPDARVLLRHDGTDVNVTVVVPGRHLPLGLRLPDATASAVSVAEPVAEPLAQTDAGG